MFFLTGCFMKQLSRTYFNNKQKIPGEVNKILFRSGFGSGRFEKAEPNPAKNRLERQHGFIAHKSVRAASALALGQQMMQLCPRLRFNHFLMTFRHLNKYFLEKLTVFAQDLLTFLLQY
jgi:hypothetical protein